MLKVNHVSSGGAAKRSKFELPASYDESVHEGAMYHAVRAFLANRRQGTASTKTRGEVSVLLNDGEAVFAAATNYAAGQSPTAIATGDLDGDGDLDLALANRNGGITILLSRRIP